MRPSSLGPVKRKCELDDYEPNPKKWGLLITNNRLVCLLMISFVFNKILFDNFISQVHIKCIFI